MYKHKQCLVALVCVLAAAAGDAKARLTHASKLRTRRNAQKGNPLRTPPGDAKDCAGNNPTGWYSHIIYARPDLRYVTPLDVTLLRGLNDDELYTPSWACWQGGYNDRFAAGRPTAAAAFGMRLDLAPRVAQLPKTHPWRWAIDLPKSGWGLHSESFVRTALEDARVRPVFSASPCGHRVRVRGTESIADCNATEAEPGRHQCLPLRDLKFPPGV